MMDDERRVERPMMAGKDDMTTETTKARPLLVRSDELLECPFCGGRPRQYITGSGTPYRECTGSEVDHG